MSTRAAYTYNANNQRETEDVSTDLPSLNRTRLADRHPYPDYGYDGQDQLTSVTDNANVYQLQLRRRRQQDQHRARDRQQSHQYSNLSYNARGRRHR